MTRPLVIAHRGFSARHVENTLTAYRAAIAAGADLVESDARLSADGVVVTSHDADLSRLNGQRLVVAETDSAVLAEVELPGGERMTTLEEVLREISPACPVLVDVKTPDLALIEAVVRVIAQTGAGPRSWVGVRDQAQAAYVHAHAPGVKILAFLPEDYLQAPAFAERGASAYRVWEAHLDRPEVRALFGRYPVWVTPGARGLPLPVGDVDADGLAKIVALGAAGVLLNDPSLLKP
jgi:glycerophosphoryl diester phosphodiesterase